MKENNIQADFRETQIVKHLEDPTVREALRVRHILKQETQSFLSSRDFLEIDTPVLGAAIPEYTNQQLTVNISDGRTRALPQSPQIYKQILMNAGLDKYFQFAHCFRFEPERKDRSDSAVEFMQIDVEFMTNNMSDLTTLVEALVVTYCNKLGITVTTPFPTVEGRECLDIYGTDKPDLRSPENPFAFLWISKLPFIEKFGVFGRTSVTSSVVDINGNQFIPSHHIFALPNTSPSGVERNQLQDMYTYSFDLVLNGVEVCGGGLRICDRELQEQVMEFFGLDKSRYESYLRTLNKNSSNGGFAIGLDRLSMLFSGAQNLKQVNAFYDGWWEE